MTLVEFRKITKDLPDDLKIFRISVDHSACQISKAEYTFVEKLNREYFEYFSDADMGKGAVRERAIVLQ